MRRYRFLVFHHALLAASCAFLFAANSLASVPVATTASMPKGYPINVGDSEDVIWTNPDYKFGQSRKSEYFYERWNPASGDIQRLPLPTDFVGSLAVSTRFGLVFVGEALTYPAISNPPGMVVLLTPQGKAIQAPLPLQRRPSRLLALTDGSALLIGGKLAGGEQRTNAVERISLAGDRLVVERLPDFPGVVRTSFAVAALSDGRAMLLGGSNGNYIGCDACLADTYFFDPKTKTWSAGPKMLEGRSDATATLLPDGSVLVAGGWTPGHGWNEGASRSAERWDPRSNRFTAAAPLPNGVAIHKAMWAAGQNGKQLLVAGGMTGAWQGNDAVFAYDVGNAEWRAVGENCQGADDNSGLGIGSYLNQKQLHIWCRSNRGQFRQAALRMPGSDALPLIKDGSGYLLNRGGMAFLNVQGDWPALAVGGSVGGRTAAVDAIWPDGRLQPLAPLRHARSDASIFRLPDGSVLVAGGADGNARERERTPAAPRFEWLSGNPGWAQARWLTLDLNLDSSAVLGQQADGNLIAVQPDGSVNRVLIGLAASGKPAMQSSPLPSLNRKRMSTEGAQDKVLVRGLQDGRIIVAGGMVQTNNIAVLQEDSMQPDARDKYIGIGESLPSRRHEIFDPATKVWRNSAPSVGAGGPVAILDDGRVLKIKLSKILGDQKADGSWPVEEGLVEMCSAKGDVWTTMAGKSAPLVKLDNIVKPFVMQGELFISGESKTVSTGGGPSMVQWFNQFTQQWETQWQAAGNENWREHHGRIIIRTLANGKRVVLPVGGI